MQGVEAVGNLVGTRDIAENIDSKLRIETTVVDSTANIDYCSHCPVHDERIEGKFFSFLSRFQGEGF